MNRIKTTLAALTVAALPLASTQAQHTTVTPNVDVVSTYLSRGMIFGPGPAIQPSATASNSTVTLQAWANRDPTLGWNEVDLTAKVGKALGDVRVEAAYTYDRFWKEALTQTQEVSLTAMRGNVTAILVDDFDAGKGQYAELSYTRAADKQFPVTLSGAVGYNNHYFTAESALTHVQLKAAVPVNLHGFTITPSILVLKALHAPSIDKLVYALSVTKTL